MKNSCWYILIVGFILFFSCKPKDEQLTTDPNIQLGFSTDTILFDTIFTDKLSITKRLIVTNYSKNAVNIDRIWVNSDSPYSLIINGEETNSVENLFLRGEDNIIILVKAILGENNDNGIYVVEDSIQFQTNGNDQAVKLISWGRDAVFHTQEVACDEVWSNNKPHIVFDLVYIPPECKLTINPGAEIYVHASTGAFGVPLDDMGNYAIMPGPGILVGGTLEINGTSFGKVTITDDRLEESYEHRPGIWGGVQYLASSENNIISWAEISNAINGIQIGKPSDGTADISMNNTIIRDVRTYGIQSISADIDMENCLVTNCGQSSLACFSGGTYNINHCTFAEYQFDFSRNEKVAALAMTNSSQLSDGSFLTGDLSFTMKNSIVWGEKGFSEDQEEIQFYNNGSNGFLIDIDGTNIVRSLNPDNIVGNAILNEDPLFPTKDSTKYHYNYNLLVNSPAIDKGVGATTSDLNGENTRFDGSPDIGAYEFK